MKKLVISTMILSGLVVNNLSATDAFSSHGIGAKVGTLGLGLEYTTPIFDNLDLRIGVNNFTYNYDRTDADMKFDADFRLRSAGILADYHPFSNGFIISAGAFYNGNQFKMHAKPTEGSYTINDNKYDASAIKSADAKIEFNKFAPYLGIGYSNVTKSEGLHFTADLGVIFQGSPKAKFDVTCADKNSPDCKAIQNDIKGQEKKLSDSLSSFKAWPVLSIGIHYRF